MNGPASPNSISSDMERDQGGWGEDPLGDISVEAAIEEFHDLEKQLTETMMKYRRDSHRPAQRQSRRQSQRQSEIRQGEIRQSRYVDPEKATGKGADHGAAGDAVDSASTIDPDMEQDEDGADVGANGFDLPDFLSGGMFDGRSPSGGPAKKLGVSFWNLTVRGVEASSATVRTLPDVVLGSLGPDLYATICHFVPALRIGRASAPPRTVEIVRGVTGTVRHGEIMLVLGRPGAGCSTLLKAIANKRDEFAAVEGEVRYGAIPAHDQLRRFRGEVVYCEEDDRHFAALTVWQTLWFALKTKTRRRAEWTIPTVLDALLQMFGIAHTAGTLVGDAQTRGVSGGERKRVSLAETMATRASVVCWDNSTRGLDASTALSFAKSLRAYTDVSGRTTLVTLYQAGESIYELMDKVLVLEAGRVLFQGPASEARAYFESLGFLCRPRQTTADFVTSVADPHARTFRPGMEEAAPKTADELEAAFRASEHHRRLLTDVDEFMSETGAVVAAPGEDKHRMFEETVAQAKSRTVADQSVYTVSFARQVAACTRRQAWLLWGDRSSLVTKAITITANSLIVGSLYFKLGNDTASVLGRGGVTLFAIAFIGWLQMAELFPAMMGRPTIERHRIFALYRPGAVAMARAVLDIPVIFAMTVLFVPPIYFLARFDADGGKYWVFFLLVYTCTFALTSLYRMCAALAGTVDDAVRVVGVVISVFFIMAGFVVPKGILLGVSPWFGWIYYINPMAYGFEALMTNELSGRELTCAEAQTVPRGRVNGTVYDNPAFQGCGFAGSAPGKTVVSGDDYLAAALQFSRSHLWRDFGILIVFTVFYLAVTVVAAEKVRHVGSGAQTLVFANKQSQPAAKTDQAVDRKASMGREDAAEPVSHSQSSVFTFKDITYTVPTAAGPCRLLNNVCGYARPGKMTALMGSSGAGKTTLLNTLAHRHRVGVVTGEMRVGGRIPGPELQRGTGFCEQMDLHEGTATVREALEFSALLRQERHVSQADKLAYVDRVVELLELTELQGALVASLTLEQRKRITIGVELAARPRLLLFLDEPTSGLDSQSANSIVRFLRRLCDEAGQAIVCTIHQPSSDLLEQFDSILALNRGGNTFYFGPVGVNGAAVVDYFGRRGHRCPPRRNVAEFILETAAAGSRRGSIMDWSDEWLRSDERRAVVAEIDAIVARPPPSGSSPYSLSRPPPGQTAFAASTALQCWLLTRRMWLQNWRDPSYMYSRLYVNFALGLFNGFTFWMLPNDVASLQNRVFSATILSAFMAPAVVNSVVIRFFINRMLWEVRELPSRTYGWAAFSFASIVCEIPVSLISGTIYFLLWYFPAGLPTDASTAGYCYLMVLLWSLFLPSWGQWIGAVGPTLSVVANLLPFFFVVCTLFSGVFNPYASFPVFWKYWIYYAVPNTWFTRGVLSAILPRVAVVCDPAELAMFSPPPGQTCAEYAAAFVTDVAGAGYLTNPDATASCGYCSYRTGAEFMTGLNVHVSDKWMTFGILCAYVVANWGLVFGFTYACRVKGWSFGIGYVVGGLGSIKDWVFGWGRRPQAKGAAAV